MNDNKANYSSLASPSGIASNNLDLFSVFCWIVIHFEVDIFYNESPHIITASICMKMSFYSTPSFDSFTKLFCNDLIEFFERSHRQLRLNHWVSLDSKKSQHQYYKRMPLLNLIVFTYEISWSNASVKALPTLLRR